ncbi:DNA polymerase III subunit gamma and tau [Corynebacterium hansenii]|uniref:DNA-directed DNA polymerase n=1 Tax=Corynebacterium hansenii TaxID=394964 RepID=A0ABV7ZM73_9CORY|nr:DNA polymerase III subunit gamma and tau [Corynebacterium hansenii]WJY98815.1 DNA polymerase III subunit tau [Corynebacterium hansenii]
MALYRKYRPATFAEVVGQRHVTDPLSAALESRGADGAPDRINHAYLFSGPRGCGKTSSARILARSLNCVEGPTATPCGKCASCVALGPGGPGNLDVVELDAASHNSVDDMRDLRDKAMYAPAESRYRIFIIDEAHMVTSQGFNALLKIVEEPPEHLIFIFATTEPEKVLTTIRSRTHHYPFRLLPPNLMRGLLERIVGEEGVAVADDVYPLVVRAGGGSPRDSLSVMDQLLAGAGPEGVSYELAAGLLGVTDQTLLDDALSALAAGDRAGLFGVVDRVVRSGQDPKRFAEDLLGRVRDLLVIAAVPNAMEEGLVDAPEDRVEAMREQATSVPTGTLTRFADVLQRGLPDMSGATSPRLLLEVLCARMLLPASEQSVESLIQRIEALERGGVAGGGQQGQQAQPHQSQQQSQPQQAAPAGGPGAMGGPGGPGDDPNLSPLQRARLARQAQNPQAAPPTPPQQTAQPVQPTPAQQRPEPAQSEPQQSAAQPEPEQPTAQSQPTQPTQPQVPAQQQNTAAPEVPDQEEQARKAREMREISRRMQEQAREQERAERERMAKEREAAARAAEGDAGSVAPQQEESAPAQPAVRADEGAAGTSSSDHLQALREAWPQVVEYAGEGNIPVRVMAAQAVPVALDEGVLTIGHHTGALANRLNDPGNAAALGAAVRRVQGIEVEVRCVVGTAPRGGGDRSGARPRQHQAPAGESSEGAKPAGLANDRPDSTVGDVNEGHSPAGMSGGHSVPDGSAPVSGSAPAAESAPGAAAAPAPESAPKADEGRPVPAYRRILEQRRRAQEAARRNAETGSGPSGLTDARNAAGAAPTRDQAGDGGKKKYVPPPPAAGTQGVTKRRHDDIPLPPEPYDDVPPPPDPDYGGYPDDGGYAPPPDFGAGQGGGQGGAQSAGQPGGQPAGQYGGQPGAQPGGQYGGQGVGAPAGPSGSAPTAQTPGQPPASAPAPAPTGDPGVADDGLDDEERELLDAARTPGQLDHRDQKEVVMELLAKELGAKPL